MSREGRSSWTTRVSWYFGGAAGKGEGVEKLFSFFCFSWEGHMLLEGLTD